MNASLGRYQCQGKSCVVTVTMQSAPLATTVAETLSAVC